MFFVAMCQVSFVVRGPWHALMSVFLVCSRRVKVNYIKGYDARPIAPVPNSGHEPDYDHFASTLDLRKADPW